MMQRLDVDRVLTVPEVMPCPHCKARPEAVLGTDRSATSRVHFIYELKEETDPVYRKPRNGDTWHFTADCSGWPHENYVELEARPNRGELCNECEAKQGKGRE